MKNLTILSRILVASSLALTCFCGVSSAYNYPLQNVDIDISQFDIPSLADKLNNNKNFIINNDGSKCLLITGEPNKDAVPDPRHIPYDLDEQGNRVLLIGRDSSQPYAVKPPTTLCPNNVFEENWSNTYNYTYTKYYFSGGTFVATADTNFVADFYKLDGTFLDSTWAWKQDGQYIVNALIAYEPFDYYVILTNKASTPSKNALYFGQQFEE